MRKARNEANARANRGQGMSARLRHAVWPPLSRPLRWHELGWLLFPLALGAGLAFLLATQRLALVRPRALYAFALLPWLWWIHRCGLHGLGKVRGGIALFIRMVLVAAAILLLAEPQGIRRSDTLNVMYALDVSDSIQREARDSATGYMLATLGAKRPEDRVGLSVFGRDAAVELPPDVSFPFEAVNSAVRGDGTDIAQALSLTAALLPEGDPGRIVLMSDGSATAGRLEETLDLLRARRIPVDVVPVDYRLEREVWLERLDLPARVKVGEAYEASVLINSLAAGNGTLVLEENGRVIHEQPLDWSAGRSRVRLPIRIRAPGFYEYRALVEPAPGTDGWKDNNVALGSILLRGKGSVLAVVNPAGDARDSAPLLKALRTRERDVTVVSPRELPRNPDALAPYDAIVMVDAPADMLDAPQMQAIHDAVLHHGCGLLMLGGESGFGPGGYNRTPVARALPVEMEIKQTRVLPKGALAIILHTCEFPEGNTWGKRISLDAIRVLHPDDEAGVIAYTWEATSTGNDWIVPLSKVAGYDAMVPKINQAQIGDMPSFDPAMQLALAGLKASSASSRHLIIISDGDPSPPAPGLLDEYRDNGISVTTVSVFPHGGQDVQIMRTIAQLTGGRYYNPTDANQLPQIFMKEAKTIQRKLLRNETFVPDVGFPSAVLKGIDAMPPQHGYVLTSAKPSAEVVLSHTPEGLEETDPILAIHRYGLGTTAAFTGDFSTNWGKDWLRWDRFEAFAHQLVQHISRTEIHSDLETQTRAEGDEGAVEVTDQRPGSAPLRFEARVRDPDGTERPLAVSPVGPGRYAARFPLRGEGRYQVFVSGVDGPRVESAVSALAVPYSPEYLRFRADPLTLHRIAEATGGRMLRGDAALDKVFDVDRSPRQRTSPLLEWFFLAIACLVPLDVILRRVQFDPRGWWRERRRPTGEATATMQSLLHAKRKPPGGATPPRPAATPPLAPRVPLPLPKKPEAPAAPSEAAPPPSTGTAGRLLAAKRRRKDTDSET
jgi:uncharacterized membrane protein